VVPDEAELADVLTKIALALLSEASLKEDLSRLVRVTCDLIPTCSGASVSMIVDGEPTTVATTDHVTLQLDLVQYSADDGPCVAALGGEAIRIGFVPADTRFPHFAIGAADRRVLSVLSTPAIDHGTVVGSLNLYSHVEEGFDEQARGTALVMAGEIANALIKSSVLATSRELRDQLQEQHDASVVTSRAEGVLMSIQDCSAAQAEVLLRNAAAANQEPIIRTTERILASVETGRHDSAETR
jgi:GAF domain-containing protein